MVWAVASGELSPAIRRIWWLIAATKKPSSGAAAVAIQMPIRIRSRSCENR